MGCILTYVRRYTKIIFTGNPGLPKNGKEARIMGEMQQSAVEKRQIGLKTRF
jgi:hypothetical protein